MGSDGLDLGSDGNVVVDFGFGVVGGEVVDDAADLFFDVGELLDGAGVGDGFGGAEDAEPVAAVGGDAAFVEVEGAGVAGADVRDEGVGVGDFGIGLKEAKGGLVDEMGHVAVINDANDKTAGDLHAVEEDFVVAGFGEDVGGEAANGSGGDSVFGEGELEVVKNGGGLFDDGSGDDAGAEDVARERKGTFEVVEGGELSLVVEFTDEQGDGGGTDMDQGE